MFLDQISGLAQVRNIGEANNNDYCVVNNYNLRAYTIFSIKAERLANRFLKPGSENLSLRPDYNQPDGHPGSLYRPGRKNCNFPITRTCLFQIYRKQDYPRIGFPDKALLTISDDHKGLIGIQQEIIS